MPHQSDDGRSETDGLIPDLEGPKKGIWIKLIKLGAKRSLQVKCGARCVIYVDMPVRIGPEWANDKLRARILKLGVGLHASKLALQEFY